MADITVTTTPTDDEQRQLREIREGMVDAEKAHLPDLGDTGSMLTDILEMVAEQRRVANAAAAYVDAWTDPAHSRRHAVDDRRVELIAAVTDWHNRPGRSRPASH